MSRKITGLFLLVMATFMIHCAAKKTVVAGEKSTPAPEVQVLEPAPVDPAPEVFN